jgi:hypothetical protein
MAELERPGTYEFTDEENELLASLAKGLLKVGIMVFIAGALLVIYIVIAFFDPVALFDVGDAKEYVLAAVDYALWVLIAFLVIYLSVAVIRLSSPIRQIMATSGADISHLIDFVKDLTRIIRLSLVTLLIICALLTVSLVMMVLVF